MRLFQILAASLVITLVAAGEARADLINFEEIGVPPGTNDIGGDVTSLGFLFDSSTNHSHRVNNLFATFNNSTWIGWDDALGANIITLRPVAGGTFSLHQADFGEFFDGGVLERPAASVTVTGFFADGGNIVRTVVLDQIYDGAGPLNDFQTEFFSAAWQNLASVTFRANRATAGGDNWWNIDNIVVNIPEPATFVLFGIAFLSLAACRVCHRRVVRCGG